MNNYVINIVLNYCTEQLSHNSDCFSGAMHWRNCSNVPYV